jgi:hypothetical protein
MVIGISALILQRSRGLFKRVAAIAMRYRTLRGFSESPIRTGMRKTPGAWENVSDIFA